MRLSDTCQNIRLENSASGLGILTAECCTADGNWRTSQLRLNSVLGISNGRFAWGSTGAFQSLDGLAELSEDGTEVIGWVTDGGRRPTQREVRIRLNERISNDDGKLVCTIRPSAASGRTCAGCGREISRPPAVGGDNCRRCGTLNRRMFIADVLDDLGKQISEKLGERVTISESYSGRRVSEFSEGPDLNRRRWRLKMKLSLS